MAPDRFIDGIQKPRLEHGVQIGVKEDTFALFSLDVDCGVQPYYAFGQGAGLVAAQHVHTAESVDRREPFDDDLFQGHFFRAVGEINTDNGRQQLRSQSDRQRHGKEKRIQDRPGQRHVNGENRHDQDQCDFEKQISKAANPPLKFGFRGAQRQALRDAAEFGAFPRPDDDRPGSR